MAGLAFLAGSPARGALLIDPTGSTNFTASLNSAGTADPDDGSALRSLGGNFTLYGTSVSSLYVQADGFLSIADGFGYLADRGVGTLAGLVGSPVIAGLYDDLYLDSYSSVADKSLAGHYYSVTYSTVNGYTDFTSAAASTFQIDLFMGATTIGGFNFVAGDIAISYGTLASTLQGSTASVGVAASGANQTGAPGTTDGQISSFAGLPTGSNFFLFRPGTGGTYTGSVQTSSPSVVPEPGSITLMAFSLPTVAGLILARRRRMGA